MQLHFLASLFWCLYSAPVRAFISTPPLPKSRYRHLRFGSTSNSRLFSSSLLHKDGKETSTLILSMVHRMTLFFESMVDPSTYRFFLVCRPVTNERIHDHCPLRDLGCAWDATTALNIWKTTSFETMYEHESSFQRLEEAVLKTIQFYSSSYEDTSGAASCDDDGLSLDRDILQETPNIAHSALFLLASMGAMRLSTTFNHQNDKLDALTRGILSMQRPDGAFRTHYDGSDDIDKGIAFYPGEAMTALMEAHVMSDSTEGILQQATRNKIIPAIMNALEFYQNLYKQGQMDTNYNVWQVQAFARLYFVLHNNKDDHDDVKKKRVADYVLDLCRDIIASSSWKMLARGRSFYPNLATVEIACGLDAIVQGVHVASLMNDGNRGGDAEDLLLLLTRNADNAVEFIEWSLDRVPQDAAVVGSGGLGYGGTHVMEQRLDVTGHALAAMAKLVSPK